MLCLAKHPSAAHAHSPTFYKTMDCNQLSILETLKVPQFRKLAEEKLRPEPENQFIPPQAADKSSQTDSDAKHQGPSDYDLNPGLQEALQQSGNLKPLKPAAVLVPIIARDNLTVLLTQRTDQLPSHAGQIAFPGGKVDTDDIDVVATATREAHEEIGLPASKLTHLGFLDTYHTATGFEIQPVVALVDPAFKAIANPGEVADVFEVPLSFVMNPANHQQHGREWQGQMRYFYAIPFEDRYIWGATAGILRNMHLRLFAT